MHDPQVGIIDGKKKKVERCKDRAVFGGTMFIPWFMIMSKLVQTSSMEAHKRAHGYYSTITYITS
jgi:hypothetical protein